ncbi:unnamed protein product, partial [Mesorhabditis spiculigera]
MMLLYLVFLLSVVQAVDERITFAAFQEQHVHFPHGVAAVNSTVTVHAQIHPGAKRWRISLVTDNLWRVVIALDAVVEQNLHYYASSLDNTRTVAPKWLLGSPVFEGTPYGKGQLLDVTMRIVSDRLIRVSFGKRSGVREHLYRLPDAFPGRATQSHTVIVSGDLRSIKIGGTAIGSNNQYGGARDLNENTALHVTKGPKVRHVPKTVPPILLKPEFDAFNIIPDLQKPDYRERIRELLEKLESQDKGKKHREEEDEEANWGWKSWI